MVLGYFIFRFKSWGDFWLLFAQKKQKFDNQRVDYVNLNKSKVAALRSRLILVRLRGAICDDSGSGSGPGSGSDLKSRKTRHMFFAHVYFLLLKVLKVQIWIKMDLKNLKRAFAHDKTELPNYNL